MSWLGIGLAAGSWTPMASMAGAALPQLSPSADWDGTEASGFAVLPSDPARTTAKPALHLLTPPGQWFTSTLLVGALAMANDGGSLFDTLGIASVTFHFEGNTVTVSAPRWQAVPTERGTRFYYGWWANLTRIIGLNGYGHLYVEATPRDATMQARVIGPFLYAMQDSEHAGTLSVQPSQAEVAGSRYQSINAAQLYAKNAGWQNYRISLDEAGVYDMTANDNPNFNAQKGWCEIVAGVAGVSLGKTAYVDDAGAQMQANRSRIRLRGSNLTFDLKNVIEFVAEDMWLDGITVTTSDPAGRNELLRGRSPDQKGWRFAGTGVAWMTEVDVTDCSGGAYGKVQLVRGGTGTDMTYDIFGDAECVVFHTVNGHRGAIWTDDNPGVVVQYTGAETTATLSKTGSSINNPNECTFTARWGANTATFASGLNEEFYTGASGDGYTVQDFADWINGLPDWTATLESGANPDFACAVLGPYGTQGELFDSFDSYANDSIDVKTAPVPLAVTFNRHSDYYQQANGIKENRIYAWNRAIDIETQNFFASPTLTAGAAGILDSFFVGNAIYNNPVAATYYDPDEASSQFGRGTGCDMSHVVFAHNSMNQRVIIRNDSANNTADAYCLFANSVIESFVWGGGNVLEDIEIKNLHLFAGAIPPSNSTGVVVGGDETDLFEDAAAGDFTPAGDLLDEGFTPVLPTDYHRDTFISGEDIGDAAGAVRAASGEGIALYVPPPPSSDPVADLLALLDAIPGGKSELWDLTTASDTSPGAFGGVWTCVGESANANVLGQTESNPNRRPLVTAGGAVFDSAARGHVEHVIAGGTFSVFMAITLDPASTAGTLLSDQLANNVANYTDGSATSLSSAVQVDGVAVSTLNELHDALKAGGTEKVLAILGVDFTGDTELIIGRSSASLVGQVRRVVVVAERDFPDNLESVRTLAASAAIR